MDTEALIAGMGGSYKGGREMAKLKSQKPKYKTMDKVLSKEEIWEAENNNDQSWTDSAMSAMTIWGNQEKRIEAIAFAEWVNNNYQYVVIDGGGWISQTDDTPIDEWKLITTSQLYELYLQNIK